MLSCYSNLVVYFFECKLTWRQHNNYIKGKRSKSIGILYKVKNFLNYEALHTIYYSISQPYLSYCVGYGDPPSQQ